MMMAETFNNLFGRTVQFILLTAHLDKPVQSAVITWWIVGW
jgi:hypothetical protein